MTFISRQAYSVKSVSYGGKVTPTFHCFILMELGDTYRLDSHSKLNHTQCDINDYITPGVIKIPLPSNNFSTKTGNVRQISYVGSRGGLKVNVARATAKNKVDKSLYFTI